MPVDHFVLHKHKPGITDWNFNILLNNQPQVGANAMDYSQLLNSPFLYPPVPAEWLHITILRIGEESEFSEREMLQVAERLENKLADVVMPDFRLGPWWLWSGNPVLHITPEDPLEQIYQHVITELKAVIGADRMPALSRFIPHITLAYNKDYKDENAVFDQIAARPIAPIVFKVSKLSLIRQRVTDYYYDWEIVKEIELSS